MATQQVRTTRLQPEALPGRALQYGALHAPLPTDLGELRRQQAAFDAIRRDISRQNSWMAAPVLAPTMAVLGAEGIAAVAGRLAAPALARGPLVLTERMPYLGVGDNWATRAGRRAHRAFQARVEAKPGWAAERSVTGKSGGILRPDARAPLRNGARRDKRSVLELKPNTPSGRRAGAKAVEKYSRELDTRARAVYYNPKDYM